jgi:hypothetical protein
VENPNPKCESTNKSLQQTPTDEELTEPIGENILD